MACQMPDELRWPQFRSGHFLFMAERVTELYNVLLNSGIMLMGLQQRVFDLYMKDLSEHEIKCLIGGLAEMHRVNEEHREKYDDHSVGSKMRIAK